MVESYDGDDDGDESRWNESSAHHRAVGRSMRVDGGNVVNFYGIVPRAESLPGDDKWRIDLVAMFIYAAELRSSFSPPR